MAHFPTRSKVKHHLSSLKNDPSGWVELYTEPDVADIERIDESQDASNITRGLHMLTGLIVSWAFEESDGSSAAITLENVRRLGMTNIDELLDQVNMPGKKDPLSPKANAS